MSRDFEQRLLESELNRESAKNSNVRILSTIGADLINSNRITTMEIHSDHDVHAFFRSSSNPNKVIHVQTYPGFSDTDNISMMIREIDYQKLMDIRAAAKQNGGPSIGNEHAAVTRNVTEGLTLGPLQQYVEILKAELPLPTIEGASTEVIIPLLLE